MYRGVCSFKLTKHLLGVELSFAPMYPKIPVRRICEKKLTILINSKYIIIILYTHKIQNICTNHSEEENPP